MRFVGKGYDEILTETVRRGYTLSSGAMCNNEIGMALLTYGGLYSTHIPMLREVEEGLSPLASSHDLRLSVALNSKGFVWGMDTYDETNPPTISPTFNQMPLISDTLFLTYFSVKPVYLRAVIGKFPDKPALNYIDGCSAETLVYPPIVGEPCLNMLHIPHGVNQSKHYHPADRIGYILKGKGTAFFRDEKKEKSSWEPHELEEGMGFYLPAFQPHHFSTTGEGEELRIVIFHPYSSWGPDHKSHQMLDETILQNRSE